MATAYQERQSNSLRVLIYGLLESLINIICSFHMIVIIIVELTLTSCAQCKILTYRGSKNEAKKGYTKAKKSILVSGNWPGKHSFSLTRPHIYNIYVYIYIYMHIYMYIYIYIITYKQKNKQTNKQKKNQKKEQKLKRKENISGKSIKKKIILWLPG